MADDFKFRATDMKGTAKIYCNLAVEKIRDIKSRIYARKEKEMGQKVAELIDEKCELLQTFSQLKQKLKTIETSISAQTAERESLEEASQKLQESNDQMEQDIERLQKELAELQQIVGDLDKAAKERKSQLEQDKIILKIHEINTERLQKNLLAAKEEHGMLLESTGQLTQEAAGWGKRLSELEVEVKMCERSHAGMLEDCANKDERIKSLRECLLKMRDWDSDEETIGSGLADFHQKQKAQKLIESAKMSADLKFLEKDKFRVLAKLADENKAKEDLQEGIKQLEEQNEMLKSESATYSSESQKLQLKLQIMTEMNQEKELKLHRMLMVEEREHLQIGEKLNKAEKKMTLAAQELSIYRQIAKELDEELERTTQAYKSQIVFYEQKANNNWMAARKADRLEVKRENAYLCQRLTDAQFKLEILEKYLREGRTVFRGRVWNLAALFWRRHKGDLYTSRYMRGPLPPGMSPRVSLPLLTTSHRDKPAVTSQQAQPVEKRLPPCSMALLQVHQANDHIQEHQSA